MAVEKRATAIWQGNLLEGSGTVSGESGALGEVAVSWPRRAEQGAEATSPEELIAAAHAACYSMALSHGLAQGGTPAEELRVTATVGFQPGQGITGIHLDVNGTVPGLDQAAFAEAAAGAAAGCPVSKALAGVGITHAATLE
ncbi:MAG: OsmC family peroxiredoxin [Thermoleophilia bacterium]|nr:OsmC family peroxiredoxin [Thermoleophilia bacterium]